MPHSQAQNSVYDSNVSRRTFLHKLSGLALTSTLAPAFLGCPGPKGIRTLDLWGTGTLDISEKWARLEEELSIRIQFEDNKNDPGPVIVKLRDGEAKWRHMGGLQGGAEKDLVAQGLIIPWNTDLIPNFAKLWPSAREIEYTIVDGKRYGIPSVINADSMIYLPEHTGIVDSYAAVFDPDFRGKTSMEDTWINSVIFTAIYLKGNDLESIQDPGNLHESELRNVMAFLTEKAREGQFRKLWRGWEDGVQLITSGEVWVMTGWEPIVLAAQEQGVDARYAVPREGYEGWSNDLILFPGVENAGLYEAAHEFLNWELSGFYGCVLADERGYVVPTDESVRYAELHPEEFLPSKISDVVNNVKRKFAEMKGRTYWQNVRPDNYQLYEEEWSKFRNSLA